MRMPEDLSIIGFDDIALAAAGATTQATMVQPTSEMARMTNTLLVERFQGQSAKEEPQRIVLSAELTIRDSCAALSDP